MTRQGDATHLIGGALAGPGKLGHGSLGQLGIGTAQFIIGPFADRDASMIRSMTAFASAEGESPLGTLACELRSVNHRYLEISPRLPEDLRRFEPAIRERIGQHLGRGKVDVTVRLRSADHAGQLQVDHELLQQLARLHGELADEFPGLSVQTTELLRYPGVVRTPDVDEDALQSALLSVLDGALQALTANREREGERLASMLRERLDGVADMVTRVRECLPDIRQGLRQRLETRLAELQKPVEAGRLEQELVLQVNRADVAEELDRLDAHVAEAREVLQRDEPVGRRLDFLMQEFNREANTLGSKSVDTRSSDAAVELKVLIEQMREQVQNIE